MTMAGDRNSFSKFEAKSAIRIQYLLAFLGAAIGTVGFGFWGPRWLPALWAAAWMLGYLGLAKYRAPEHAKTPEFADNYYYLGFLLTLVALVGVLVQLGYASSGGLEEDLLLKVLSQFGLALVTTIIGLVGRTAMLMFRPTLEDLEEEAENRLTQAFDEYTMALNRLTEEANTFSHNFGKSLETSLSTVEDVVVDFGTTVQDTRDGIAPIRAELADVSAEFGQSVDRLRSSTSGLADRIAESSDGIGGALTAFGESVRSAAEDVEESTQGVGRVIENAERELDRPLKRVQEQVDSFAVSLTELSDRFSRLPNELARSTERTGKALGVLAAEVQTLKANVQGLAEIIAKISGSMDFDSGSFKEGVDGLNQQVKRLSAIHSRLAEEARGSSEAIVAVRRELASGIGFLVDRMNGGAWEKGDES